MAAVEDVTEVAGQRAGHEIDQMPPKGSELGLTGIRARVPEARHDDDCIHDRFRPGHRGDPGRRLRRRPHRRRRGLRYRRRVPPAGPVPRPELRHPGRPGQPGRNLVDAPVPGRALRQRPVHLRLPVQAVARARRSRRARRSSTTSTRSSTTTTSTSTSATSTASPRPAGPPRTAGGPSRSPGATPGSGCGSPPASCGCARATTTTPSPTGPSGKAWTGSRAWSCTPSGGPRTLTWRASGSS